MLSFRFCVLSGAWGPQMQAGEPQGASCFHSPGLGLKTQSIMPAVCFHGPNPSRPLFTWVLEVRLWSSGLFYKHLAEWNVLLARRSSPPPQYGSLLLTLKNHLLIDGFICLKSNITFLSQESAHPSCACGIFISMFHVITGMSYHTYFKILF